MGFERGVLCVGVGKMYASEERTSQNSCAEKHNNILLALLVTHEEHKAGVKMLLGILGGAIGILWETGPVSFPSNSEAPHPLRFHPSLQLALRIHSNLSSDILSISVNTVQENTKTKRRRLEAFLC